jgi:tetratricopeptide (TPR) repeat protein
MLLSLFVPSGCRQLSRFERPRPSLEAWRTFEEGERLRLDGKPEQALVKYREAIELDPFFVEAHREVQNRETTSCRRAELQRTYRRHLREHPESAVFHYLFGRIETDPDRQRRRFREAVRLDPSNPWGHYGLGYTYHRDGDFAEAASHYRRALAADPAHVPSRLRIAEVEMSLGRREAAIEAFVEAVAIAPGIPESHLGLAAALASSERHAEALTAALPALRVAPAMPGVYRTVLALLESGATRDDLLRLRGFLDEGMGRPGVHPLAHRLRAEVSRGLGEPYRAIQEIEEGLAAGGDPLDFALPLRDLRIGIRDYPGALSAWRLRVPDRVVLEGSNRVRDRYVELYRCLGEGGEGAVAADAPVHRRLAAAFERVGWLDHAEAEYRYHLLVQPDDAEARQGLDQLLRHRRFVKAVSAKVRESYEVYSESGRSVSLPSLLRFFYEEGDAILEEDLSEGVSIERYSLIGSLVRPGFETESALARRFDRYGQVLVVGRQAGGPPEAYAASVLALGEGPPGEFPKEPVPSYHRVLIHDQIIPSYREHLGARIGGIALGRFTLVNFDVVLAWQRDARLDVEGADGTVLPAEDPDTLLEAEPGDAVGDATCVARRLYRQTYRDRAMALGLTDPFEADYEMFLSVVDAHEYGHLVDFHRFVPLTSNLLRGLSVFLDLGLSRSRVEEYLEENAQLAAIALSRYPRAALAQTVTPLLSADAAPPHSRGYHRLTREWIRYIRTRAARFPRIDPGRSLVQQLPLLEDEEIREIALALAESRGIRY